MQSHYYSSCRLQTRATLCITVNVLQTNKVDAQCNKLATELKLGTHCRCPRAVFTGRGHG